MLNRQNQLETADIYSQLRDITQQLRDLTQDTVDDSATVRIITIVSAFYLPGSFVAVSRILTASRALLTSKLSQFLERTSLRSEQASRLQSLMISGYFY